MELLKEDDIFGSLLILDKEHLHNSLIIYLYENEDILIAGELLLEINEDSREPVVIESLLKSSDEDDAGFIMFEAKI